MQNYSAKLLFQWLPIRKGKIRKRRVCEERIITFTAESANEALRKAKKIGRSEQYVEQKPDGEVRFEFIGVLELRDISLSFDEGEVWSEIKEMVEPMERRDKLIPKEDTLDALRKTAPAKRGRLAYY